MQKVKLGDILPYEQPAKYIVESTNYSASYETPVLTAGKTFLLGYTNEINGIYNNLPCIIFDDFTTVSKFVNFPFKVKSSAMKILTALDSDINLKYFYYLMQTIRINSQTHKRFWISEYSKVEIPLPTLPEQERIVQKIEELFSELDKGIEELTQAKARLKVYRQAVLKDAFEGKPPHIYTHVKNICDVVRGGSPRPAGDERFYNGKIPFLKVADLTGSKSPYLTNHTFSIKEAGLKKTRKVNSQTLLLSNSGATLGVPKICTFDTTFNDGIAAFLNMSKQHLLYHYYFWESKTTELRAINQGAAQPNLNTNIIGNVVIPIPTLQEQKEIALKLESRLSTCDNIEQTIHESLKKAENLRQSILKKAFEGKLV